MWHAWRSARSLPAWLQVMFVGQFVNAAGSLAWVYLTLYLVSARHLSVAHAGVLVAVYGAGLIAGNLLGGGLGDRIGLRRALLVSLVGWAAACLAMPVTPVPVLPLVLVLAGLLTGGGRPLTSALVLSALPTERRREGAALGRVVFNAGTIVGPPLGALAAGHHFGVIFLVDALTSLVLAGVVRRCSPTDRPVREERASHGGGSGPARLVGALRTSPLVVAVLLTVMVVDASYRQYYVALPLQLRDLGRPALVYGLLITANCVVIVLFEVPLALLLARRRAVMVIAVGYALVGVGWLTVGAEPALGTVIVAALVVTGGEMLYKPTATATVADGAPPGLAGSYQSLYAAASITGMVLGPALGGAGYGLSPRGLWLCAGAAAVVMAATLALAAGRRARPRRPSSSVRERRAVVTDLDGTIVRADGTLSATTRSAVAALAESDTPLIVATARTPAGLGVLDAVVDDVAVAVCCNGGLGCRPAGGERLWQVAFDPAAVSEIVDVLTDRLPDAEIGAYDGRRWTMTPDLVAVRGSTLRGPLQPVPTGQLARDAVCMLVVCHPRLTAAEVADVLGAAGIGPERATISYSTDVMLDLAPPGVDKAAGVARALDHLGIDARDTVGFGDARNDLPMFGLVGHAVAVANADPVVLAAADSVTADVETDGFSKALAGLGVIPARSAPTEAGSDATGLPA